MLRLEAQEDYFRAQAIFVADAVWGGDLTGGEKKGAVFETAEDHEREVTALQKKLHLN